MFVDLARFEMADERLENKVVPLFSRSRLTMKSCSLNQRLRQPYPPIQEAHTWKKDVKSWQSKSPSIYASANPMSANRNNLIQKASFLTINSARGVESALRGKPVVSNSPLISSEGRCPKMCLVPPGSSTSSSVPLSIRDRMAKMDGFETLRAGPQLSPPTVSRRDSTYLDMIADIVVSTKTGRPCNQRHDSTVPIIYIDYPRASVP